MGIRHPLGNGSSHAWNDTNVGAYGAASYNKPPVSKGVLNPFHHTTQLARLRLCNAGPLDCQIDNLREGKEP